MPQAVERRRVLDDHAVALDRLEPGALDCACEDAAADVAVIVRRAVAGREHEVVRARAIGRELVSAQLGRQRRGDLDAPPRPLRLQRHALALAVELVRERHRGLVEVDLAPHDAERLAEPRAGLGRELEDRPVGLVDRGEQAVQLVGREHALGPLVLGVRASLDAIEQRQRVRAGEAEMTACVLEDRREHGELALDRPALEAVPLLRGDERRDVGRRDVRQPRPAEPIAQALQAARVRRPASSAEAAWREPPTTRRRRR